MGMLTDDMKRLIDEQKLGFVATVCADGAPNLSPKGTLACWDDRHLAFADIASPGTIANIRANPLVEVNVVDPIVRRGYRFKGQAAVHVSGPLFDELYAFFRKRGSKSPIDGVVLIDVERAAPLTSPLYDLGLAEAEIAERWQAHFDQLRAARASEGN